MGFSLQPKHLNHMVRNEWPESQFVCEAVGEDSATAYIDIREEVLRPGGYVSGPSLFAAARFSRSPSSVRAPAPKLGEHTQEILQELGYDADAQEAMIRAGIARVLTD